MRMKKETRATRFVHTVEGDPHRRDQQHCVAVDITFHQQGTLSHEDVSINCKHFSFTKHSIVIYLCIHFNSKRSYIY